MSGCWDREGGMEEGKGTGEGEWRACRRVWLCRERGEAWYIISIHTPSLAA